MCSFLDTRSNAEPARKATTPLALPPLATMLNGYDHPALPVTVAGRADTQWACWGLVPAWAVTDEQVRAIRSRTLNARSETMFQKPAFQAAARTQRCLVWVRGFYEWQHHGKQKQPYYLRLSGQEWFALGGLYTRRTDPASALEQLTCTIVTTAANELMQEIHNTKHRMPLILLPGQYDAWIRPSASMQEVLSLARPLEEGLLEAQLLKPGPGREPVPEPPQLSLF